MKLSFVTDVGLGRKTLTTVAEALERLSQDPAGFRPGDQATCNVADLPLPNGRTVPTAQHCRNEPVRRRRPARLKALCG